MKRLLFILIIAAELLLIINSILRDQLPQAFALQHTERGFWKKYGDHSPKQKTWNLPILSFHSTSYLRNAPTGAYTSAVSSYSQAPSLPSAVSGSSMTLYATSSQAVTLSGSGATSAIYYGNYSGNHSSSSSQLNASVSVFSSGYTVVLAANSLRGEALDPGATLAHAPNASAVMGGTRDNPLNYSPRRRVIEPGDEEEKPDYDPEDPNFTPVGATPWLLMLLMAGGYIYIRQRREEKMG